jgi:hypothetical protein
MPPGGRSEPVYRFLSRHEAAVLDAAARDLVSKADIDPPEHLAIYVDHLLSVFDVARAKGALRQRVVDLRDQYVGGIALLDRLAGGDFTAVPPLRQQLILTGHQVTPFADLLFDHIVEAMYITPRLDEAAPQNRRFCPTRRTPGFR